MGSVAVEESVSVGAGGGRVEEESVTAMGERMTAELRAELHRTELQLSHWVAEREQRLGDLHVCSCMPSCCWRSSHASNRILASFLTDSLSIHVLYTFWSFLCPLFNSTHCSLLSYPTFSNSAPNYLIM